MSPLSGGNDDPVVERGGRTWVRRAPPEMSRPEDRRPPAPPPPPPALRVVLAEGERSQATEKLLKAARTVVEEWRMGYVTEYAFDELDGAVNDAEAT